MFDVTDKSAVDRLAAVVAMLDRREAEASADYLEACRLYASAANISVGGTDTDPSRAAQLRLRSATARLTEAQSALAAARELATDR